MRRFSRPGTGTILGSLALFVALGGTAFAAGATVVNIADPTTQANVAHVNSSGQLQVSGPVTVSGTVTAALAAPRAFLHRAAFDIASDRGCASLPSRPAARR
jgi:hypothetical protein